MYTAWPAFAHSLKANLQEIILFIHAGVFFKDVLFLAMGANYIYTCGGIIVAALACVLKLDIFH